MVPFSMFLLRSCSGHRGHMTLEFDCFGLLSSKAKVKLRQEPKESGSVTNVIRVEFMDDSGNALNCKEKFKKSNSH